MGPANELKLALERLGNCGTVKVSRTTAANGFAYAVTFTSKVGDMLPLVASGGNLIGAGASVAVVETMKGTKAHIKTRSTTVHTGAPGPLRDEIQIVKLDFGATDQGGTFKLSFNRQTTAPIAWNAANTAVASALQALITIGSVTVSRATVNNGYERTITFSAVDGSAVLSTLKT